MYIKLRVKKECKNLLLLKSCARMVFGGNMALANSGILF